MTPSTPHNAAETGAPNDMQGYQLVNRAFSSMPHGGGLGLCWIAASHDKDAAFKLIAHNLDLLATTLRAYDQRVDQQAIELRAYYQVLDTFNSVVDALAARRQLCAATSAPLQPSASPSPAS